MMVYHGPGICLCWLVGTVNHHLPCHMKTLNEQEWTEYWAAACAVCAGEIDEEVHGHYVFDQTVERDCIKFYF